MSASPVEVTSTSFVPGTGIGGPLLICPGLGPKEILGVPPLPPTPADVFQSVIGPDGEGMGGAVNEPFTI